jgi:hypothetical protein
VPLRVPHRPTPRSRPIMSTTKKSGALSIPLHRNVL